MTYLKWVFRHEFVALLVGAESIIRNVESFSWPMGSDRSSSKRNLRAQDGLG